MKKVISILFLLVLFLSLAAVSADDLNTTADTQYGASEDYNVEMTAGLANSTDEYYDFTVNIKNNGSDLNNVSLSYVVMNDQSDYSDLEFQYFGNWTHANHTFFLNGTLKSDESVFLTMRYSHDDFSVIPYFMFILKENDYVLSSASFGLYYSQPLPNVPILSGNKSRYLENIRSELNATDDIFYIQLLKNLEKRAIDDTRGDIGYYDVDFKKLYQLFVSQINSPCPAYDIFHVVAASDLTKHYGGADRFEAYIFPNCSCDYVIFNINGVDYTRSVINNTTSIAINLNPGNYTVKTSAPQLKDSIKNTVCVLSTIESQDLIKYFRDSNRFEVRLLNTNESGVDVEFNINGVLYTRKTNGEGIAGLNINLSPGKYVITTYNPLTGERKSNNITVLSQIESSDLVKYYRNDSQFVVKILNKTSGNVSFNINGVFYTRQINESGHAKLNINLAPGSYIITTMCGNFINSNNITVLSRLIARDLNMSFRDGSKFLVKLLDEKGERLAGKNVTFNINGVFYNRTTDSMGMARLNINLGSGNYIITSICDGMMISNSIYISPDFASNLNYEAKSTIYSLINDTEFVIGPIVPADDSGYRVIVFLPNHDIYGAFDFKG